MKKKFFLLVIIIFVIICFVILFKGLNKSTTYVPDGISGKKLISFDAKKLFNNDEINSDLFFVGNKFLPYY